MQVKLFMGRWQRALVMALLGLFALVLLVALFPWDLLRGPLNRYVSERIGRRFEITRKLDVDLGRETRVLADGVVIANPPWAQEPYLVQAERAVVVLRLWPLIRHRQLALARVLLVKPRLALELRPDGARTWSLERRGRSGGGELKVDAIQVDQGSLRFISPQQGADMRVDFAMDAKPGARADAMPLSFRSQGTWHGQSFNAQGRTGNVLGLRQSLKEPFPGDVEVQSGGSSLHARGYVGNLAHFDGADLEVELRGPNLADLYRITGLVLPATPAYTAKGHVRRDGKVFQVADLQATVGHSDLAGELSYDWSGARPLLRGELRSQLLDFTDLAPLVGKAPQHPAAGAPGRARAHGRRSAGVLPDTPLDVSRLARMNADLRYAAHKVVHVERLPLERIATHVKLQDGTLDLQPLELGVAGGRLVGQLRVAGQARPVKARLQLDARDLSLGELFPSVPLNRASVGNLNGRIDLSGQGASIAKMLGTSSGELSLLLGRGHISNLLLEFLGLDAGEIIKFFMGHDPQVAVRCGAVSFDVKQGLMRSRVFVLDTVDTVIYGAGTIDLAREALDLTFKPYPKDMSILALRSPLKLTGPLGAPKAGVDRTRLAERAGLAIALAAINPLLGLAATVETGPGKNADCTQVLNEAARPRPPAKAAPRRAARP